MDRADYTARVLAQLRHVTGEERAAIRAEIDGHMEDHICALLDLGYDQALAEERTLAAMGDPAEVGREIDKQYPLSWLVIGRAAVVLTAVMCLMLLVGLPLLGSFFSSVRARTFPPESDNGSYIAAATAQVDVRVRVGNDIVRIYRIYAGAKREERKVSIAMCAYDRIPGGIVMEHLLEKIAIVDQRGQVLKTEYGSGSADMGASYLERSVRVAPEDTYVTLRYERFGERLELRLSLPEEVTP